MEGQNVIEVNDVRKSFKVFNDRGYMLKEMVLFANRRKYEIHDVLNGISFNVKKGEAIGLIGQNGCGKSTTLKLLTKIIYPDSGSIEMRGRVSSLIELGAGFHPDMSGRENIYINASIFGLTRREIEKRLDDIISFSELEKYIDNPVRTYSSGMYMRLAFSVAINVDADILLIDEILGVGDANFQVKCFNKLREIKAEGTTIVIVSHSLGQIEQICERSIWIQDGQIRKEGTPREVHPAYLDFMGQKRAERNKEEQKYRDKKKSEEKSDDTVTEDEKAHDDRDWVDIAGNRPREIGSRDVVITDAKLYNSNHEEAYVYNLEDTVILEIKYKRNNPEMKEAVVGFNIFRNDGIDFGGSNTFIDKLPSGNLQDEGIVRIELNDIWFAPAKYEIDLAFSNEYGLTYHHLSKKLVFEVIGGYNVVGLGEVKHKYFFDNICVGKVGYGR